MVKVRFSRLHPGAMIPRRSTEGSAGYDLYCPCDVTIGKGRSVIPLGFAVELPEGYAIEVIPRSGYASKGFEIINDPIIDERGVVKVEGYVTRADIDVEVGLVDSDYRGCMGVIVNSHEARNCLVRRGQRIAQMLLRRVEDADFEECESLGATDRQGGFGSTGS